MQTQNEVVLDEEAERKLAYLFCAEAITEKVLHHPTQLSHIFEMLVARIEKAMRAAAAVPPIHVVPDVPVEKQVVIGEPKLTAPVVQALAVAKVNGNKPH
jgi:hypothetical protein